MKPLKLKERIEEIIYKYHVRSYKYNDGTGLDDAILSLVKKQELEAIDKCLKEAEGEYNTVKKARNMFGHKFRLLSIKDVIDRIKQLKKELRMLKGKICKNCKASSVKQPKLRFWSVYEGDRWYCARCIWESPDGKKFIKFIKTSKQ